MVNFLILFLIIIVEAGLINFFLAGSVLGSRWRLFVAPGIIIHEGGHALGCLLTGAKITKIRLFDKAGGSVTHHKPFIPVVGPIIISLAPLVLGILIFYYLARLLELEGGLNFQSMLRDLELTFRSLRWSWSNILIVYLLLGVAVTMTPSPEDLKNMAVPLVVLAIALYLIMRYTAFGAIYISTGLEKLLPILTLVILILLVFLIASFGLYVLSKVIFKR